MNRQSLFVAGTARSLVIRDQQKRDGQRPFVRIGAAAERVGVALAVSLAVLTIGVCLFILHHDHRFIDFGGYYRAGRMTLLHQWADLYSLNAPTGGAPDPVGFVYPPFAAAAFAVIAWLPYSVAIFAWSLAGLAGAGALLVFGYGGALRRGGVTLALLLVGFLPLWWTLLFGQATLVLVALGAATWFMSVRPNAKPWVAALPLGLALAVKPLLLTLPVFLWASGRRACAIWSVGWAALGAVIALLLFGSGVTERFVTQELPYLSLPDVTAPSEQSLAVFFFRLAGPTIGRELTIVAFLAIVAITAYVIAWQRLTAFEALAFALAAGLLAGPRTWDHYVVLLLPAFVLLWDSSRRLAVFVYGFANMELFAYLAGWTFPFDPIASGIAWLWLMIVASRRSKRQAGERGR